MASDVATKVAEHFSQFPKRSYPKGQILVFADENPGHIFYLASGKVRKYDVSYRGDEVIVNIFKAGSYFPMSWALNHSKHTYFYKTEEPSEVHVVPTEAAIDFLKANPDVMLDLLSRIYRGMDGLLGRLVNLMSGTALSRLIYELVIECRRFGRLERDGKYVLSITEVDLAARAGLSRETVSREMKKIKEQGLVEVMDRHITITDLKALEGKLGTLV